MSTAAVQAPAAARFKTWIVWAGRIVSIAPVYILLWSARAKLTHSPWYVQEWSRIGWSPDALYGVGAIQLTCLALYLIPQTAVLGTVLLTGVPGRCDRLVRADGRVLSPARPADDVSAGVVGNLSAR